MASHNQETVDILGVGSMYSIRRWTTDVAPPQLDSEDL